MTVLAPSRSPGMGDVTVRSPTWQDGTLEMAFEFAVDPPLITSLSPVSGPQEGGTLVVIQGANFPYNPIVTFGGVAGENIAVYNNIYPTGWQTIHVLSPPGVGSVELKVGANTVYLADDSRFHLLLVSSPTRSPWWMTVMIKIQRMPRTQVTHRPRVMSRTRLTMLQIQPMLRTPPTLRTQPMRRMRRTKPMPPMPPMQPMQPMQTGIDIKR